MNIRHSCSRFALGLVIFVASGVAFAESAIAGRDDRAIIAATKQYLAANSYPADIKVTVEKVEGDYARVAITPKDQKLDPALVFLKRDHGAWKGLTIGTGWDPEDLAKMHIPANLRP